VDVGEDDVTEKINRDALERLRHEFDTFEHVQREQSSAMRAAIERLQDSQEELGARVDEHGATLVDHAADLRLLKTTVASTDGRLGRIETLLHKTPRHALYAAGTPPAIWLAIEFVNWLRAAQ
jgi:ABC-type transporter Mla subunit MlaD